MSASHKALPAAGAYNPWLAIGQLLVVGTLWGSTFSVAKFAITAGVPPLGYAFWQCFGSGLVLLAILALRGERLPMGRRQLGFYAMTGALGITAPNVNFYIIVQYVPAGLMAVVITTAPIMTFLIALSLRMERLQWLRVLGLLCGFAGALLLVLPDEVGGDAVSVSGWVLLGFLTPFFYSLNSILTSRWRPTGGSALSFACGMMLAAAALQLPLMLAAGQAYAPLPPFGAPEAAIAVQVAVSATAYIVFFHLVKLAGPVYFSQVGYIVTLTGILWGMLLFDERLAPSVYLAAAVIFAGLALVNLSKPRRPKEG